MRTPTVLLLLSANAIAARAQQRVVPPSDTAARPAVLRTLLTLEDKGDWNDFFADLARNRIYFQTTDDSLRLYDLRTKRGSAIAHFPSWDFRVSQSGDRLAFVRPDDSRHTWIWTLPLDPKTGLPSGPIRRLTMSAGDSPEYSPDGKWLAFAVDDSSRHRLVVMPANGGPERTVAEMTTGIAAIRWTPDGRTIFFSSPARTMPKAPPSTVYRVPASGGTPTAIMQGSWSWPGLSFNGDLLMFRVDVVGVQTYAVATADGRQLGRVTLPAGYFAGNWASPTSVAAARTEHPSSLGVLPVDGGAPTQLLDASFNVHHAYWSKDGRRIAISAVKSDGNQQIIIMDADGGNRRVFGVAGGDNLWWSPDGRYVAFHGGAGKPVQLLDAASGSVRPLGKADARIGNLHWRSDSRAILYTERSPSTPQTLEGIHEITLDGADRAVRSISPPLVGVPYMASDSNAVVMSDSGAYLVSVASGKISRLTSWRGSGGTSQLNGERFAFRKAVPKADHEIEIVNKVGQQEATLTFPFGIGPAAMLAPIFLPDGQHLIISGQTDAERAIYLAPVTGGDPKKLAVLPKQSPIPYLALSPDGKHLLFTESAKTVITFSVVDLPATLPSLKSVNPAP